MISPDIFFLVFLLSFSQYLAGQLIQSVPCYPFQFGTLRSVDKQMDEMPNPKSQYSSKVRSKIVLLHSSVDHLSSGLEYNRYSP